MSSIDTLNKQLDEFFAKSFAVCTDSRSMQPEQLFFALRGPNFNGNVFAEDALMRGATAVVMDDPAYYRADEPRMLLFPDALKAMQDLAGRNRKRWGGKILAVTGSNGKTTTKELLRAILAQEFKVFVTPGNFNNHIGVPLCLLQINQRMEMAVLEFGDNHPGEIEALCQIAHPDVGLITNIGLDHIEGFGSEEVNVAAKRELFEYLEDKGKTLLINENYFPAISTETPVVRFGTHASRNYVEDAVMTPNGLQATLVLNELGDKQRLSIESNLWGHYNAENILSAVIAARHMGARFEAIKAGIAAYKPANNRGQIVKVNGRRIILDAYNANPSSMKAVLDALGGDAVDQGETVGVVLGGMKELGHLTPDAHIELAANLDELKPVCTVLVGPEMLITLNNMLTKPVYYFGSTDDLLLAMKDPKMLGPLAGCTTVLFKGSRSYALERAAKALLTWAPV